MRLRPKCRNICIPDPLKIEHEHISWLDIVIPTWPSTSSKKTQNQSLLSTPKLQWPKRRREGRNRQKRANKPFVCTRWKKKKKKKLETDNSNPPLFLFFQQHWKSGGGKIWRPIFRSPSRPFLGGQCVACQSRVDTDRRHKSTLDPEWGEGTNTPWERITSRKG